MSPKPDLSRRKFLVHSAGVAGASLGGVPLDVAAGLAGGAILDERRRLRLGFVGLGDRGRQLLGSAIATGAVEVVGLCDVDPKNLKRSLDIVDSHTTGASGGRGESASGPVRGFTDASAMFSASDIDAVVIATPVFLHRDHTIAALAAGKHVYCEKPMALDRAQCAEVRAACVEAAGRGQIYQSGLQRRYNPRYRASVRFLHEGTAGEVHFLRAQWHAVGSARKSKPWIYRREKSGDIVIEQASHQFDVFNWIFGAPPIAAIGMGGRHHDSASSPVSDVFDHYGAVLEYPGGAKVQLSHLTYAIPDRRFSGIYELAFCEKTGVDIANALTWDSSGRTKELSTERGNETKQAMLAFVGGVTSGRKPFADADAAYHSTMAALLCREAIDSGRRVTWDEFVES